MNFSTTNSMYRKYEQQAHVIKNQRAKFKNQIYNNYLIRNKIINSSSTSGKSYSSIKSFIKRIQSVTNTKNNQIKLKIINQRPDIFLQGGSIQNPKIIDKQKFMLRTTITNSRNSQAKTFNYLQDPEYSNQVFISQKKVIYNRSNIEQNNNNNNTYCLKTSSTLKNMKSENINKKNHNPIKTLVRQRYTDSPTSQSIEVNQQNQNNLIRQKYVGNYVHNFQHKHYQTQKTTQSIKNLSQQKNINVSMSQIQIKKPTKLAKRIKVYKPFCHPTSQQQQNKKQSKAQQQQQLTKPLFYLSQQQIKDMRVTSRNFIITEFPSGQIITGSYTKQVAEIASLTKIVTFYCCLTIIEMYKLDMDSQMIMIDQQIEATSGTSAELLEGDVYSFRQICYGLMLPSGNDAALAMAKWGGAKVKKQQQTQTNLKIFMKYMNQTCQSIGMKSTFFGNPHGLPHSKSGTTVQDISIIINKALNYEFFREVIKTKLFKCQISNNNLKRQIYWQNTNKLLRRKGFIGVKTGVTVTAGPCLATCYQLDDKIYTIVLLKTTKLSRRFKQTRILLGKILSKINYNLYKKQINQILHNDKQFDSDNSQDQQEFNYQRNDAQEMKKRLKIITYQM